MEHAGCPYIVASTSFVNAIRANSLAVAQWLQTGHLIVSRGDSLFLQGCSDGQYSGGQFSIRVFSRIPVSKFDTDAIRAPNMLSSFFPNFENSFKFRRLQASWARSKLLLTRAPSTTSPHTLPMTNFRLEKQDSVVIDPDLQKIGTSGPIPLCLMCTVAQFKAD